jgi:hypothetical protein
VLDEGQLMGDMALQAAAGGLRTATVAALSHLVAWQLTMEDVRQLLTPEDIQVSRHMYLLLAPHRHVYGGAGGHHVALVWSKQAAVLN